MTLDKIFQEKAEKPAEEKKLQVISSESSIRDELLSNFQQSIPSSMQSWEADFNAYASFLQSYDLQPGLVSKIYSSLNHKNFGEVEINYFEMDYIESRYFEIFLSALIQASYNQGNNNFVFENVDTNFFAELLMGKKEDPIKIEAQAISGNNAFRRAQNCTLEIASYTGLRFGHMMGNCQICTYDKGDLDRIRRQVFWGKNNSFRLLKK